EGVYTFFLNAQGRILADANLYALEDYVLIDTEPAARRKLYEHLDKYIIADDVILEDVTDAMATIALEGPTAEDVLVEAQMTVPESAYQIVAAKDLLIASTSLAGTGGFLLFVPVEQKTEILELLERSGAVAADEADLDLLRTENRIPRFGLDFGEDLIAHETGQMRAVHFSKGCYLGQEIVERVRSRGHLNKKLYPLEFEGEEAPAQGTRVLAGTKDAGRVTSAFLMPDGQRSVGFAVVRTDLATEQLTVQGLPVTLREYVASPVGS
ncbi:MAG TPA: hypothetical protein VE621_20870, partial [Bryobacteraceae bacterium]|nr:hypothetical protein [Bryobacteraceae bacterium]